MFCLGCVPNKALTVLVHRTFSRDTEIFSSPGRSPGRAIALPSASALAKCKSFYIKGFYVMGKALSGELSCPCDRSCFFDALMVKARVSSFPPTI